MYICILFHYHIFMLYDTKFEKFVKIIYINININKNQIIYSYLQELHQKNFILYSVLNTLHSSTNSSI
jgi:hypothetical protein